jgi:3-oxoacyl-[acyl-carrier-protein] synthase II
MNVAQYFGLKGYVMATSAACASGLQAIGTGYQLLKLGLQDVFLCGGAEELHASVTGTFDLLYATSTKFNGSPGLTPRPFDRDRDGLVCGEGGGLVVMETLEHAEKRGAKVLVEITGYETAGSGEHVSQSDTESMIRCMKGAMGESGLKPSDIGYINAHATATLQGDKAEADAIREVFGPDTPVSSLKGYMGHTLGASGAIELIATIEMMRNDIIYPGLNLDNVAPDCQGIGHLMEKREVKLKAVLKNCFAFGGVNTALICVRP